VGHTGVTEDAAKSEGPTHAPLRPWLLKAVLYLRRSERLRISASVKGYQMPARYLAVQQAPRAGV
jgi:hypothetical protein